MLKAPKFWYKKNDTYLSNSLYPLSLLFRFGTKIRNFLSRKSPSSIPVICIGNIVVGGAGKTPVALKIGNLLKLNGYILILFQEDMEALKDLMFLLKSGTLQKVLGMNLYY